LFFCSSPSELRDEAGIKSQRKRMARWEITGTSWSRNMRAAVVVFGIDPEAGKLERTPQKFKAFAWIFAPYN
jgi:hypothetical protein